MSTRGVTRMTVGAGLLAVCLAVTGCGSESPPGWPEPLELRTYEVPPELKDTLRDNLQGVLNTPGETGNPVGRVRAGPGGTLLVVASPRIHRGIVQLLAADFEAPPPAAPVRVSYWFLVGRPLATAPPGASFRVAGEDQLARLEPVLSEIATAQGPIEFTLVDAAQITSTSGHSASASGRFANVQQMVTKRDDGVTAEVNILANPGANLNTINSEVTLAPGQFLVLGQAGYAGRPAFDDRRAPETLYVVMSAD